MFVHRVGNGLAYEQMIEQSAAEDKVHEIKTIVS